MCWHSDYNPQSRAEVLKLIYAENEVQALVVVVPKTSVCSNNTQAEAIYIFHQANKIHEHFT